MSTLSANLKRIYCEIPTLLSVREGATSFSSFPERHACATVCGYNGGKKVFNPVKPYQLKQTKNRYLTISFFNFCH